MLLSPTGEGRGWEVTQRNHKNMAIGRANGELSGAVIKHGVGLGAT